MDIARRHQGQVQRPAGMLQRFEPGSIVRRRVQFHGQPGVDALRAQRRAGLRHRRPDAARIQRGQPVPPRGDQHLAALQAGKVAARMDTVFTLGSDAPRIADEFAQVAPAGLVARQGHEPHVAAGELAAHDELQAALAGRGVRSHHAGHGAFVRQSQRRIAEFGRALHEFERVRGPRWKLKLLRQCNSA